MNHIASVRVAITCDYCETLNQLLLTNIPENQVVRCSHCGAFLGRLDQLPKVNEAGQPLSEPVSSEQRNGETIRPKEGIENRSVLRFVR